MSPLELIVLALVGVAVGIFSALFGVGGGLLMVPVLVLGFGVDQHTAQGTSLAVIVPTALAGAYAHHKRGFVDLKLALALAAGGVLGVVAGARLALAIDGELLGTLFGLFLIFAGLRMALGARRVS